MKVFLTARALKNYNAIKQHIKIEWGENLLCGWQNNIQCLIYVLYPTKQGNFTL